MKRYEDFKAEAIRAGEAEEIMYALVSYMRAMNDRSEAYSRYDGPSPGYALRGEDQAVSNAAVDAVEAVEKIVDRRTATLRARVEQLENIVAQLSGNPG